MGKDRGSLPHLKTSGRYNRVFNTACRGFSRGVKCSKEELKKDNEKDLGTHHLRIHQEALRMASTTNGGPD